MRKLILASASPRRRELLQLIAEDFSICPPDADETLPAGFSVSQQIELLASRKAEQIFAQHPDSIVIGADTMVVADGVPLGKPADAAEAKRMLRLLSGRQHEVITGLAVQSKDGKEVAHSLTKVYFRTLSDEEIDRYIATGEPLDKAGAYGIQGKGAVFVTGIEGDYFSVVGLPVAQLYMMLSAIGYC